MAVSPPMPFSMLPMGGCVTGGGTIRRMPMSGRFGVIGQERKGVFKPIFLPVKAVNAVLRLLRLEKHPDKTFIGKIERGFDFLGYHFSGEGLRMAKATIQRFVERAA